MRDTVFAENDKGERVQIQRLGVLENASRPLNIDSDRSYAEVFGMAYREMPTASMLPMFFEALSLRRPESRRRVQYLKGAPGSGKTYMSELIGRMRDPRGPIIVNCGDKNLAELLYETVLDFGTDRDFYAELEKRLAKGALNPLSLKELKKALGPALLDDNGTLSVDWSMVGEAQGAGDENTKRDVMVHALAGLERVRSLENLGHLGGNALGMAAQEGPLIRAWKEGREIVLDEYNKRKEGTDGGLQRILQFLAGEIDECVAENTLKDKGDGEGQAFVFRRSDMRVGFFATLTGNDETDGSTTFELSQSVHSRISPEKIPKATVEDWQHRICQILTGMPISTIYRADEKRWNQDPAYFGRWLKKVRTAGLNPEQVRNIPVQQMRLLDRWEDVLKASEIMAKFYYGWSMMIDPDSELARSGQLSKLMMEINDTYRSEVSIDFRRITEHVSKASEFRPEVKSVEDSQGFSGLDFDAPPERREGGIDEDPVMRYGSRLAQIIITHITRTTSDLGKMALHRQLMKHATDCGIIPAKFNEAKASERKTLAQLLDEDLYDDRNINVQADLIRRLIYMNLREKYGAQGASDDDIISMQVMRATLEAIGAVDEPGLIVMNSDADTAGGQPLQLVSTQDMATGTGETPDAENLLPEHEFLATLAMPRMGDRNLNALWTRAISASGMVVEGEGAVRDRSIGVAEGDEKETMRITTVTVRAGTEKGAKVIPLHIMWNTAQDRGVIIGQNLKPELAALFNARGITFISRDDAQAQEKVKVAIGQVVGASTDDEKRLKAAFLLRNQMERPEEEAELSLAQILVSPKVQSSLPHFILNRPAGPEAKAA